MFPFFALKIDMYIVILSLRGQLRFMRVWVLRLSDGNVVDTRVHASAVEIAGEFGILGAIG